MIIIQGDVLSRKRLIYMPSNNDHSKLTEKLLITQN